MAYKCVSPNRLFYSTGASVSTTETIIGLPVCVKNYPIFYMEIQQSLSGKTGTAPVYASIDASNVPLVDMTGAPVLSSSINEYAVLLVARTCSIPSTLSVINFVQAAASTASTSESLPQ